VPPPPAPPSQTSQPNVTKNPAPDSRELNNTLEKLRALQKQEHPPTAKANPAQGGAPRVGGSPNGDVTARLTGEQRGAIGDQVRECWTKDAGALDIDKMSVMLTVTLDAAGVVREATVADSDRDKLGDPRFRAFAERAIRAPMSAQCSNLGQYLPKSLLGQVNTLTFRFRP
jgi:outer membrane biosynthesis protein TonB